jgi:hypothetical protein
VTWYRSLYWRIALGFIGCLAAAAGHVDLRGVIEPGADVIAVDRARFEQAVQNLAANALRYAPEQSLLELRARNDGDTVALLVSDEGAGIPAEHLPRVFDRTAAHLTRDRHADLKVGSSVGCVSQLHTFGCATRRSDAAGAERARRPVAQHRLRLRQRRGIELREDLLAQPVDRLGVARRERLPLGLAQWHAHNAISSFAHAIQSTPATHAQRR